MKHKIQKLLLICGTLLTMLCITVSAYSENDIAYPVTGGNIYFDASTGTITDCDNSVEEVVIPEKINGVPVTSIGEGAFYGFWLRSIAIPKSVTHIGEGAFLYCDQTLDIYIEDLAAWCAIDVDGVLFYSGANLYIEGVLATDLTIPDSVTSIGEGVFSGYTSLRNATIADSVISIGERAFDSCTGLRNVTISNSVISIGNSAFAGCTNLNNVIIPDSVTNIGSSAFWGCDSLTEVTIPGSVTSMGDYVFASCDTLRSVTICDGVTRIGDEMFDSCDSLISVIIPNSVTSIEKQAFRRCGSLTEVTIPGSVSGIGYGAFESCDSLVSVTILEGVTFIAERAFQDCTRLENILFPDTLLTIEYYAFNNCSSLTSIILPENLTSIGACAFEDCTKLEEIIYNIENLQCNESGYNGPFYKAGSVDKGISVVFGDSVLEIPFVFRGVDSITSITIGKNVTLIHDNAFEDCTGLEEVIYLAENAKLEDDYGYCYSIFDYAGDATSGLRVTFGSSVKRVPNELFYENNNLVSVTFEGETTEIGDEAFAGCTRLQSIELPQSLTKIGTAAFSRCTALNQIIIHSNSIVLGNSCFSGCTALSKIALTDAVVSIGANCFSGCTGLIRAEIDASVIGNKAFYDCTNLEEVSFGNNVSSIGDSAFRELESLKGMLSIPSVSTIGEYAFYNCTGLTGSPALDHVTTIGAYAFSGCTGFDGQLTLGNKLSSIGDNAFSDCTGLTGSLIIPDSVKTIGGFAFLRCTGFNGTLTIGNGVQTIDTEAFSDCSGFQGKLKLGNSIETIGKYAFDGCSGFTGDLVIPNSVKQILQRAFYGCTGLNGSLIIGNNVELIDGGAFYNCPFTGDLIIPDSVVEINSEIREGYGMVSYPPFYGCKFNGDFSIGDGMSHYDFYAPQGFKGSLRIGSGIQGVGHNDFENCNFTQIIISDGVTSIDGFAFSNCKSLVRVDIPDSMTTIGESAFSNCGAMMSVTIPNGVTNIGDRAFSGCSSLENVTIPKSVTSIGNYVFSGCSGLSSVTIPEGITSIGDYMFSGCSGLSSITVPKGVTNIGDSAFYNCIGLNCVEIPESVTSFGKDAFFGCNNLKDIYYLGSKADWNKNIGGNELSSGTTVHFLGSTNGAETGTQIRFDKQKYTGKVGEEIELFATLKSGEYDCRDLVTSLEWCSSDEEVFSIKNGEIDAIHYGAITADSYCRAIPQKAGTAVVTVTTSDGSSTSCMVEVGMEEISIYMEDQTVKLQSKGSVYAMINGSAIDKDMIWIYETDNPDVVSFEGASSGSGCAVPMIGYTMLIQFNTHISGTANITLRSEDGTVTGSCTITVVAEPEPKKPVVSSNHYNATKWEYKETPKEKAQSALNEYIDQWMDAYEKYVRTLETELSKEVKKPSKERSEQIALQADALEEVYEIAFPYKFPEEWKPYVYQVLCTMMMNSIEWNMDSDEIDFSDEIASEANIINQIYRKIANLKHSGSYQFDECTITVSGMGIYSMTVIPNERRNGVSSYIIPYCKNATNMKKMVNTYVDTLKDLEQKAVKNAYSETLGAVNTIQELLGLNFGDDYKEFLQKKFKKIESFLEKKKLGDAYRVIVSCVDYYNYCKELKTTIFSTVTMDKLDESDIELLNNLLWIDETTENKAVKKAEKKLKDVSEDLSEAYLEYLSKKQITPIEEKKNILDKVGDWWDNIWSANCPVDVEVYNSKGEQIGYVGTDDIWYDDSIYIEEYADAKKIYSSSSDPVALKIVGTDIGNFDLVLEEYQDGSPVGRLNFYDMSLHEGKSFSITAPTESLEVAQETLVLTDDEDGIINADAYIPVTANARVQVSTQVKDETGGKVSGAGLYAEGDAVVLRAIPNEGYRFVGWYDNDAILSNTRTYEFTARKDIILTAAFEAEYPSLENYAIQVSNVYCDKYSVEVSQDEQNFIIHVAALYGSQVTDKFTAILATYTDEGQLSTTEVLSSKETEMGIEFYGVVTEYNTKIFLLDEALRPVIQSYNASL